jgi:UDP-N-acetylmuramyl tripeptide synthase
VRIPLAISTLVARAVGTASRRSGKGGGTTLPGRVLNALNPAGMARLAARLEQGSAIISATNGKTTTAAMTAAILASRFRLAGNPAGANLSSGISTALLYTRGADLGLFEVDEAALPQVTEALKPRVLCLGNLFRDQLDRYGELELLAERWRGVVSGLPADNTLAVNEDDPQLAQLTRGRESVIRFGIEDERHGGPLPHAADARYCSACGAAYSYELAYVGHLGKYSCPGCGFERMRPNIWAEEIELAGLTGSTFRLRLPERTVTVRLGLPGIYNIYNALAAATVGYALGARAEEIASGLESTQAAFGRSERIAVGEQKLLLLLIKNPTGANEVVRTLVADGTPKTLVIALNDEIADGQDTSWIWDVDFEPLLGGLERLIASGGRAAELALRFKYAGFPEARIEVVPAPAEALDRGLELTDEKGELIVCPTYTAMLELQDVLVARGHADPYWQRAARAREESGEARKPR